MESLERLTNSPCLIESILSIAYNNYTEITAEAEFESNCQEIMLRIQLRDLNLRRIECLSSILIYIL